LSSTFRLRSVTDPISIARYRTLQAGLTLIGLLGLGGALTLLALPRVEPLEVTLFALGAALCLVLVPVSRRAATGLRSSASPWSASASAACS
jgi:hypothetical protein